MRQSRYFLKTSKTAPADDLSVNARLLEQGGFIYKNSAGIYTYLPLGWRVMQRIARIIREEMDGIGGQEMFMPALVEKKYLSATNRWELPVGFKVFSGGSLLMKQQTPFGVVESYPGAFPAPQASFALGWTHEEIMSEIASRFLSSYKDLPFATYQIQTKFRNEPRAKSGLLRGREFMMKDLYSFHRDEADLDQYYELVGKAYSRIFERCGLKAYLTLAAGGDFTTNYTHEFQVACPVGEDTIYICSGCEYAENKEITKLQQGSKCPRCGKPVEEKPAVEVGNIFRYGTKYSEPFNLQFTNEKGEKQYAVTGAYGIGIGRLMATVVEIYHDSKGIIWPRSVSPFEYHLLLLDASDKKVVKQAESLYQALQYKGLSVLFDDRDASAGVKFADSDLIGISTRLVVSKKTLEKESVEVKARQTGKVEIVKIKEFLK